jgi:predicted DNA-binding transcriptional regulator AlpA
MTEKDDEILIDGPQLAKWLAVSSRTPERWRNQHTGPPFVRVGKSMVRYRKGDVRVWINSNTRPPTEPEG